MASRVCPHCGTEIPAASVAAFSNNIECPKCKALLEVGSGGRTISSFAGFAAAAIVWRLSRDSGGILAGVVPTLYAFLTFGIVSSLVLLFTANLQNAPAPPVPEPAHSAGGHGGGHH